MTGLPPSASSPNPDPDPDPDANPDPDLAWFPSPDRLAWVRLATAALVAGPPPLPGQGGTARRWQALHRWARTGSVSVARLAEAHLDATAILAEAHHPPAGSGLYGVWASAHPSADVHFDPASGTITGVKRFCSGLGVVERALVTAVDGSGTVRLVDIGITVGPTLNTEPGPWTTPALADTATGTVHVTRHPAQPVGAPGWYLDRPGFWHGAIGPAACWAGAAAGLADAAERPARGPDSPAGSPNSPGLTDSPAGIDEDPYRRAARGELRALDLACRTLLDAAGDATDAAPGNGAAARYRALATRHVIERSATTMADRFSQAFGPRPFVADGPTAQRLADLHLYLRQHHGDGDLAHLAGLPRPPDPEHP